MGKQQVGNKAKNPKTNLPIFFFKRISEGIFIFVTAGALFILLSLCSYELSDPSWTHVSKANNEIANAGGQVGAYIADALYFLFGYFAFLLPLCAAYMAWFILKEHWALKLNNRAALFLRGSGLIFLMIGGCALLSLEPQIEPIDTFHSAGGVLGSFVSEGFEYAMSIKGATLLLLAIFLVGVTLLTGLSWVYATEKLGNFTLIVFNGIFHTLSASCGSLGTKLKDFRSEKPSVPASKSTPRLTSAKPEKSDAITIADFNVENRSAIAVDTGPLISALSATVKPVKEIAKALSKDLIKEQQKEPRPKGPAMSSGGLPSLGLLDKGAPGKAMGGFTHQELENLSREVEQHLLDFGIQADVVAVHPGPVITRFELQLAAGIKVSKLTALAKDLARSLSVTSVRVVEVIPGKTVVGLELPNQHRAVVRLSEVLCADVYQQAHSPITLALGVDIAGHPMVVDLAKMPHLLVAGTTGSGKSVGINAMILSLLFKATPAEVRLIMVDPKMLELSIYDGIPHLLTPVVTDMKEAAAALRWCVGEMERRYRLMSALGVRNLQDLIAKSLKQRQKATRFLIHYGSLLIRWMNKHLCWKHFPISWLSLMN